MSCNGCRVLRKGCNENCVLRQSLQGIQSSLAQANATVFVAKFFGRADLMSFLSAVPDSQRPALFQSLLFEACGRTVNPVGGAVGLLWTGNWHVCQSAVETVLRGGGRLLQQVSVEAPALGSGHLLGTRPTDDIGLLRPPASRVDMGNTTINTRVFIPAAAQEPVIDLNLCLTQQKVSRRPEKRRAETPSLNSEESDTTTLESGSPEAATYNQRRSGGAGNTKLLRLFI